MSQPNNQKKSNFSQPQNQVAYSQELSKNAKFLYWILTTYSNPCYPSYKTLMGLMEVGRSSLSKAIQELTTLDIITYKQGNSHGNANEYTILPVSAWKLNNRSHMGLVPDRHANNTKKEEEWSAPTGLVLIGTRLTDSLAINEKEQDTKIKQEILIDRSHMGLPEVNSATSHQSVPSPYIPPEPTYGEEAGYPGPGYIIEDAIQHCTSLPSYEGVTRFCKIIADYKLQKHESLFNSVKSSFPVEDIAAIINNLNLY